MLKEKKWLAMLLAVAMVFTIIPTTVFAVGTDEDINPTMMSDDWSTPDTSWFDPDNKQEKYILTTASELAGFIDILKDDMLFESFDGITIELGNDIILNDTTEENWTENAQKWDGDIPVYLGFSGTFDGKGHSIIGLYSETGLIGRTSYGATIQNLVIEKAVVIQPSTSSGFDGPGAIGTTLVGNVKNCIVKDSIIRSERFGSVGAIAGTGSQATISDCQVINCSISANADAGGIVGNGGTIIDCSVDENTIIVGKTAGGIAASANTITNCDNAASVTGGTASGILAIFTASEGSIEDCNNTGKITATGVTAGGIIGNVNSHHLSISDCVNSGDVKAEGGSEGGGVGGIAGAITASVTIENCSSTGVIEGKTNVGGIVGNSKVIMGNTYESGKPNTVNNCTVSGDIIGEMNVGGLIGNNVVVDDDEYEDTSVQNNALLPSTTVTGNTNVGALIGKNVAQTDTGTIKNNIWPETAGNASGSGAGSSNVPLSNNSPYDENGQLLDPDSVEGSDGNPIKSICEVVGHNAVKTEEKAATCTKDGNITYWYCDVCNKYFSDKALTTEITKEKTVIKATGHGETELKKAKEATCTAEGYTGDKVCKVCGEVVEQGTVIAKLPHDFEDGKCTVCGAEDPDYEAPAPFVPEITVGANSTWSTDSKDGLSFTSNAAFGDFQKVQVDGKDLDASNYTVKEGSTIVTLKAEYLGTLSAGTHTLAIVSETGTATTEFTIKAAATDDESSQTPDADKDDTNTPQTGDDSNMMLWIALLFVSGGALFTMLFINKKKFVNNR